MKVTTDACIQGAWTPLPQNARRALDIGTGTGLLALMLAQRNDQLLTDAVEYDGQAAQQAAENVAASRWDNRVRVHRADIRTFEPAHKYDLIICNPPFFSNSLLSGTQNRDRARHDLSLSQSDLARAISAHIAPGGQCSVLLPYTEYRLWLDVAAQMGLHETASLHVRHTPTAQVKRVVGIMTQNPVRDNERAELVIKDETGRYTDQFRKLLGDFYLEL